MFMDSPQEARLRIQLQLTQSRQEDAPPSLRYGGHRNDRKDILSEFFLLI